MKKREKQRLIDLLKLYWMECNEVDRMYTDLMIGMVEGREEGLNVEGNTVFLDYWACKECTDPHYGMCYKCGGCGRKFENGVLLNGDELPDWEWEE